MKKTLALAIAGALAGILFLTHSAFAFPRGGGGGAARGGRAAGGGLGGSQFQGGGQGRFGGLFQNGGEGSRGAFGSRRDDQRDPSTNRNLGGSGTETLGDTDSHSYDTRGGGSVDTNKTTDGDTTSRDTTYTNADGDSATHSGSVTKDDGSFNYSGSSSNSAGASSHSTASGTYSNGQIDSMNTSVSGKNAAGQTADHDGNWNRNGNTVNYYGSSWTSTGKNSDAAATVTKTDDGFVAHGAAVTDQGAAAGTVVKDGNDVYGRSVATNGETVNHNWTTCNGGDCTRTTVTTSAGPYYASPYYYHPTSYAYYACPAGSTTIFTGAGGTAVYGCSVTPVTSLTIPLTGAMMAMKKSPQTSAHVTSSPVLMYQTASDTSVYATTYTPQGLYWEKQGSYYYWVPGAAQKTTDVTQSIGRAMHMKGPTDNATVITYTIGESLVYLTNQAPLAGIYSQRADPLYAWIPGVTTPTTAQRDTIATAVTAHQNGGAQALANQMQQMQANKPPPS